MIREKRAWSGYKVAKPAAGESVLVIDEKHECQTYESRVVVPAEKKVFIGTVDEIDRLRASVEDPPDWVKVDINSAPVSELARIVHIDEWRAGEIVAGRPWSCIGDLIEISGIGPVFMADIHEQNLTCTGGDENAQ